ncbi:hypothetical protein ACXOJ4_12390 [Streptococcus thermophilus]
MFSGIATLGLLTALLIIFFCVQVAKLNEK